MIGNPIMGTFNSMGNFNHWSRLEIASIWLAIANHEGLPSSFILPIEMQKFEQRKQTIYFSDNNICILST